MPPELIFELIGAVVAVLGILAGLYNVGKRVGNAESRLDAVAQTVDDMDAVTPSGVDLKIRVVRDEIKDSISVIVSDIQKEYTKLANSQFKLDNKIDGAVQSLNSANKGIDSLLAEIRQLSRSDASVGTDINYMKDSIRGLHDALSACSTQLASQAAYIEQLRSQKR